MQKSKSQRLHALDGLRGIAIIMVFLSHLNATFISRSGLLNISIFDSGVIGVSFLFILSGFLMVYLYPQPKSIVSFIQKRYTRIFPLFLTVCSLLFVLRYTATNQWFMQIGILLLFALIAHIVWVYIIKRFVSIGHTKIIFFTFIVFQLIIGMYYLWIMQHPAVYYYEQMSTLTRSFTNWFVNATLLLPIGRYVEMLDPVYWSLAAEVLFYLLYPFICVPIIAYMSQKSKFSKVMLLLCLFPFFGGIYILSQHILYLNLLRFHLFYYFVTGMTVGYLYRKHPDTFSRIDNLFPGFLSYVTIILFFGSILFAHIIEMRYPAQSIWIQMSLAFPFTFLLCIALADKTALSKFFRSKILIYFGTISYSIYLSHMFILNLAINITKQPTTLLTTVFYVIFTLLLTVIISSILYFLLEKPYFSHRQLEKKTPFIAYVQNNFSPFIYSGISLGLLFAIFIVYQSNLNFFTVKEPYNNIVTSPISNNQIISFRQYPTVTLQLKATHANFGVISMHLLHETLPDKKFVPQRIEFQIKEKGSDQWYATSQYTINNSSDSVPISFGFPLIANAAGKTYIVSITQKVPSSSEYILLDNGYNSIGGIFFVDKKIIIKHPQQLLEFLKNKMLTVIRDIEAQQIMKLSLPFIIFTIYILVTNRRNIKLKYSDG